MVIRSKVVGRPTSRHRHHDRKDWVTLLSLYNSVKQEKWLQTIFLLTNEIIGLSHVIVPDWDVKGFLGKLAMLYVVAEFLDEQHNAGINHKIQRTGKQKMLKVRVCKLNVSRELTSLNSGLRVFFLICVLFLAFFPMSGFRYLQNRIVTLTNIV